MSISRVRLILASIAIVLGFASFAINPSSPIGWLLGAVALVMTATLARWYFGKPRGVS